MSTKLDDLDKVLSLMEKTNKLFVTGVINNDTKEAILAECKGTVDEIFRPIVNPEPAPAEQPDHSAGDTFEVEPGQKDAKSKSKKRA